MTRIAPLLMVGTGNEHKTVEVAEILGDLAVRVLSARCLEHFPIVEESGRTFEENAAIKAKCFAQAAAELKPGDRPRWVLSDDSGLCVDALDGRPGVLSARYAMDICGESATDADNNRKLLQELEAVGTSDRRAHFVCTIALVEVPRTPEEEPSVTATARGECHGVIALEPRGEGGFGYDPLFLVPELGRTFAEVPAAEKNRRSHRAQALAYLKEKMVVKLG